MTDRTAFEAWMNEDVGDGAKRMNFSSGNSYRIAWDAWQEAIKQERERVIQEQRAHDEAAKYFHQTLCTRPGFCRECERIEALRARSSAPDSLEK